MLITSKIEINNINIDKKKNFFFSFQSKMENIFLKFNKIK